MSLFGKFKSGNFTAQDLGLMKFEVRVIHDPGQMDSNDAEGLMFVLTKAGLCVVDEMLGWSSVAKLLMYTCINEVTRLIVSEAMKFFQNNYIVRN